MTENQLNRAIQKVEDDLDEAEREYLFWDRRRRDLRDRLDDLLDTEPEEEKPDGML